MSEIEVSACEWNQLEIQLKQIHCIASQLPIIICGTPKPVEWIWSVSWITWSVVERIHLILHPRNYIEYEVAGLLRNQSTDGEWQKKISAKQPKCSSLSQVQHDNPELDSDGTGWVEFSVWRPYLVCACICVCPYYDSSTSPSSAALYCQAQFFFCTTNRTSNMTENWECWRHRELTLWTSVALIGQKKSSEIKTNPLHSGERLIPPLPW